MFMRNSKSVKRLSTLALLKSTQNDSVTKIEDVKV